MDRMYIARKLEGRVTEMATFFPAVVVIGPRQVGKTSLVQAIRNQVDRFSVYLDLERERDLATIDDLESYSEAHRDHLIILDEIQRKPSLFPELRSIIDRHRSPGRFILLGSASLDLIRDASESLAGRIAILELTGLQMSEVSGVVTWQTLWLRGGFPQSLLAPSDKLSTAWRSFFVQTYLERDLAALGLQFSTTSMVRLFTMVAHLSGQLLNTQSLSRSLGIDARTVERYLDFLEETFLIRRLPPYYANVGKRLTKSVKLFLRDTGVLHQQLGIVTEDDLLSHPIRGASFESLVIEQVYAARPPEVSFYFYRTHQGAEVDLVLVRGGVPYATVEIKNAANPKPAKGFYTASDDLQVNRRYIVSGGDATPYLLKGGVEVVSLRDIHHLF